MNYLLLGGSTTCRRESLEPVPPREGRDRVGGVGESVDGLGPGLGGWGFVKSVFVVSLDYLCLWQVQASVYCARRIPEHLRCTQCLILLQLIDIDFLTCICLWQIS